MNLAAEQVDVAHIVRLEGRFDSQQTQKLVEWMDRSLSAEQASVIVNMAGVTFIDSSGLATIVKLLKRSAELGGTLALCEMQNPVWMIFRVTRMDKAISLYASEEEALEAIAT